MLLAVNVGNTLTTLGLLDGERLVLRRVLRTRPHTADELVVVLRQQLGPEVEVTGAIVSTVVPNTLYAVDKGIRRAFGVEPLVVGRGLRTGLPLRTDNPREVGSDRIVNSVAAVHTYGAPVVVVRFGTALTVDCVNPRGEYIGGAIAPGLEIAEDALFSSTAKLPRVSVERPAAAIGRNTVNALQSGLYWGFVGQVDGLVGRCKAELGTYAPAVGTGGLVGLLGADCASLDHLDRDLALRGLGLLYERNR